MKLYLDTSAVVSIFLAEQRSSEVARLVSASGDAVVISDLAGGEYGAAISTAVRTERLTDVQGREALQDFDAWYATNVERIELTAADVRLGASHVRRFDLALLFPDALHLALCARSNATLLTGDRRQADAAHRIGVAVTFV